MAKYTNKLKEFLTAIQCPLKIFPSPFHFYQLYHTNFHIIVLFIKFKTEKRMFKTKENNVENF